MNCAASTPELGVAEGKGRVWGGRAQSGPQASQAWFAPDAASVGKPGASARRCGPGVRMPGGWRCARLGRDPPGLSRWRRTRVDFVFVGYPPPHPRR